MSGLVGVQVHSPAILSGGRLVHSLAGPWTIFSMMQVLELGTAEAVAMVVLVMKRPGSRVFRDQAVVE